MRRRRSRREIAQELLERAHASAPEERDGQVFRVLRLPDDIPYSKRRQVTRYHLAEVGKAGRKK